MDRLNEVSRKRKNLQTNIRTKAREHRDGSKDLDRFWGLVDEERKLGGAFDNPAPFLLKQYWEDPRTKDGKPTGDENDVYIVASKNVGCATSSTKTIIKEVVVEKEEPTHKYDLIITIKNPKVEQIDGIYKFFDNLQLLPIKDQNFEDELTLVYRFSGTKKEFDILKQAVVCTMDVLTGSDFSVMVRGRQYDMYDEN